MVNSNPRWGWFRQDRPKGKGVLVKSDMARGDHSTRGKIEAPIASMITGITQENAGCRSSHEFVRGSSCLVWETKTAENPEMIKSRRGTEQPLEWSLGTNGLAWVMIEVVCSCR